MFHLLLYSLTILVNSIRPSTDCHKTPWNYQFVEDSHSLGIWKPFVLSTLLLNLEQHHPFISYIQYPTKSVKKVHLLSWSAYRVQSKRGDLESKARSVPPQRSMEYPELNCFKCRTVKYPETTQIVHLGTIVEEPKCGKIELGACLGSPDCSGPDTLILFSSVGVSTTGLHSPGC